MEKNKLYIPLGVKIDQEYFNGFGKKELKKALFSTLVLNIVNAGISIFKQSVAFTVMYFMFAIFLSFSIFVKDESNISFFDQCVFFLRFYSSQKKIKYIYQKEL